MDVKCNENGKFTCINCGKPVKELYKKYSAAVLKLVNCEHCNLIADKYIEYDTIIIIIDLILLSREAYRHIQFNTSYNFHWKLSILTQLMEAYTDWMLMALAYYKTDFENRKAVVLENFTTGDLEYYKMILKVVSRNIFFFLSIVLLTIFYNKFKHEKELISTTCLKICKCISISSFGVFLFLPALIWDVSSVHEYHFIIVCLYTSLSQLVAYTVICKCNKLWSITVIVFSYFCKTILYDMILLIVQ